MKILTTRTGLFVVVVVVVVVEFAAAAAVVECAIALVVGAAQQQLLLTRAQMQFRLYAHLSSSAALPEIGRASCRERV